MNVNTSEKLWGVGIAAITLASAPFGVVAFLSVFLSAVMVYTVLDVNS